MSNNSNTLEIEKKISKIALTCLKIKIIPLSSINIKKDNSNTKEIEKIGISSNI